MIMSEYEQLKIAWYEFTDEFCNELHINEIMDWLDYISDAIFKGIHLHDILDFFNRKSIGR